MVGEARLCGSVEEAYSDAMNNSVREASGNLDKQVASLPYNRELYGKLF